MTTLYLHTLLPKDAKCYCDDCGWTGKAKKLKPIRDIDQRLHPGEEIPAGECPRCGTCAYRKPKRTVSQKILRKWYKQTSETDKVFTVSELNEIVDNLHTLLIHGAYSRPEKPAPVPASKMFLTDEEMKAQQETEPAGPMVLNTVPLPGESVIDTLQRIGKESHRRLLKIRDSIYAGRLNKAKAQCDKWGYDFTQFHYDLMANKVHVNDPSISHIR